VVLSQTNVNRRVPSYRGVIYDRDRATLGVAIDPPDDELPDEATWRIDLSRTKFRDCVSKTPSAAPRAQRR